LVGRCRSTVCVFSVQGQSWVHDRVQ
jgi:hypothetical protein